MSAAIQASVPAVTPREVAMLERTVILLEKQVREQKEVIQLLIKLVRIGCTQGEVAALDEYKGRGCS